MTEEAITKLGFEKVHAEGKNEDDASVSESTIPGFDNQRDQIKATRKLLTHKAVPR
jgi:hypothetical protein